MPLLEERKERVPSELKSIYQAICKEYKKSLEEKQKQLDQTIDLTFDVSADSDTIFLMFENLNTLGAPFRYETSIKTLLDQFYETYVSQSGKDHLESRIGNEVHLSKKQIVQATQTFLSEMIE